MLCSINGCSQQSSFSENTSSIEGLDSARHFQAKRASSTDLAAGGNGDARPMAPGQTLTLAELEGPGRIVHLWFTVATSDLEYSRHLTLRIYWDGLDEPAVESPLGDFFAVGHGVNRNLNSEPVAISSAGRAYNCYWPMPFRKSAKITVTNDSPIPVIGIFWQADWQKLDHLATDTPYFHAQYRQEFPCSAGNYLLLDASGKGHYAGTVLSWQQTTCGWPGEGDDFFYIDGEKTPSLSGTGTEDYIGDAWGFAAVNQPYYGISMIDGWGLSGQRCTAYRWHIKDPVAFEKSLKVTIEHKGTECDTDGAIHSGYVERKDFFSSVAFWYQTGIAKRFAVVPPGDQRLPTKKIAEIEAWYAGMDKKPIEAYIIQDGAWSDGKQVLFTVAQKDWQLDVPVEVEQGGLYLVEVAITRSFDYGIFDIYVNDKLVKTAEDFYCSEIKIEKMVLGMLELKTGRNSLRFVCRGANIASKIVQSEQRGHYLGLDAVVITKFF